MSAVTPVSSLPQQPTPHYTSEERRRRIFAIVGASSGNLVEWFDFYVYAFSAIYFASSFFPNSDPTVQLLNTAGVFAAGFLMRHESAFFWYVTAMMAIAFVVSWRLPRQASYLHHDH